MVNLAGVMFQSDRFAADNNGVQGPEAKGTMYGILIIVISSIVYFFVIVFVEVAQALSFDPFERCAKHQDESATAKSSSKSKGRGSPAAAADTVVAVAEDTSSIANPMFTRNAGAVAEDGGGIAPQVRDCVVTVVLLEHQRA